MIKNDYNAEQLAKSFGASAATYDATRAQLIPSYHQFYGSAVKLLHFSDTDEPRILDLGAGTGLLSAWVLESVPRARLTLIDLSSEMLEKARLRLHAARYAPEIRVADYSVASLGEGYDAVVSALSIHHLDDKRKQSLFARIHDALKAGGIFVNAEQVAGPTQALEHFYIESWWAGARAAGISEDDLDAAKGRMKLDRHVTVDQQLQWLREAGFQEVDLWFKDGRVAVYSGRKR